MKKIIAITLIIACTTQSVLPVVPRLHTKNMSVVCKKMTVPSVKSEKDTLIRNSLNTPIMKKAALLFAVVVLAGIVARTLTSGSEEEDTKK